MTSRTKAAVESDPARIASRLGVPIDLVRALQERGVLTRFDLSEREVRERLWQAHLRPVSPGSSRVAP